MGSTLFLDIDGVLNSSTYFDRFRPKHRSSMHDTLESAEDVAESLAAIGNIGHFDPAAVAVLNEIVKPRDGRPGIPVVLSSSWRILHKLPEIVGFLEARGFQGTLIDKTPDLTRGMGLLYFPARRDDEILTWLRHQAEPPQSFVVLEDEEFMPAIEGRVVRTTWEHGLQPEHVALALKILAQPWDATTAPMPKCPLCGNDIDPECCGCGDGPDAHGSDSGHRFVPVGCICFGAKEG